MDYEFKFDNMPELRIIINYYTKNFNKLNKKYDSLYSFISGILVYQHETQEFINSRADYDNQEIIVFSRYIDSLKYDEYFINYFMYSLDANYFTIEQNNDNLTKKQNKSFRKWCQSWQNIYSKHTLIAKSIKNLIIPFQTRFLERLWDPNTSIGYEFAIKHINKLDWDTNDNLIFSLTL